MSKRYYPLFELTRARVVEFLREPEAIFWVFVFPVLLALALGIAFRNQPVERTPVAVVVGENKEAHAVAMKLEEEKDLKILVLDPAAAEESLRKGRVDLVMDLSGLKGSGEGRVAYHFDPSKQEGRAARLAADNAVQRILGRRDVVSSVTE
ncbi:MAG: ABC transporter permease, partial [Planctomycetota bacterium]